ncbi:DedA family protein [Cellulomonas hominis]|uniref:DedA family protein n=1 Tax=Cellulomonas hominis TaxID=156981 RepID=UPI001BCB6B5D|nr:VTT domain-containing protein [Cellulomonas hominis]
MPDVAEWVVLLGGAPWALLVLFALAAVDGFFPPVPSEGAVIALAALGASGGAPELWLVGTVAAAGALTGDLVAYGMGRRVPAGRLRALRWRGARRAVAWAEGALAERGAAVVLGARFLPGVRVAVNLTAGAVGFPRARFAGLAAVAAVAWAVCSVLLGAGAGRLLAGQHPVLRVAAGVVVGAVLGVALDRVLRWRGARRASSGRAAGGAPDGATGG